MTGDNEPWDRDGWAPTCKCGVCHTCLPLPKIGPNIILGTE